jgi:hypothetical protein
MAQEPLDKRLTSHDLAKLWQCSDRSVRRVVREAMLTVPGFAPIKRGRDWLFTRADIAIVEASMRHPITVAGRPPRTVLVAPRGRAGGVAPQDAVRALLHDARVQRKVGKIALDREREGGMTGTQLVVHRKLQERLRQPDRGARARRGIIVETAR